MNEKYRFIRDERGAAIFIVLIVMMILFVLSAVFVFAMTTEGLHSARYDNKTQAYYIARSGAEAVSEHIIQNYDQNQGLEAYLNSLDLPDLVFEKGYIKNIEFEIAEDVIYIRSTGTSSEIDETVVLQLNIDGRSISDYVIFNMSKTGPLKLESVSIEDEAIVGSNSTVQGNPSMDPPENYDEDADFSGSDLPDVDETLFPSDEPLDIPAGEVIDEDGYYKKIDKNVTFDTGNQEGELYVRVTEIVLTGDSWIKVTGGDILHLLVEGKLSMGGNAKLITEGSSKVIIYNLNGSDISIYGSGSVNAYIYAPDSKVGWSGGGNETLVGGFLVKEFEGGNSNVGVIHAPELLMKGAFENIDFLDIKIGKISFERGLWGSL